MGKVISFINYKGGVGKTTLAVEMAAGIANRYDAKVLVVDLDPQTNATFYLLDPDEWAAWDKNHGTLRNLFDAAISEQNFDLRQVIYTFGDTRLRNVELVPSHLELLLIDMKLAAKFGAEGTNGISVLREVLDPIRDDYEAIICDCPPNLNLVTQNAIVASDSLAVVAMPEYLSTLGIATIQSAVQGLEDRVNKSIGVFGSQAFKAPAMNGILFNRVKYVTGGTTSQKAIMADIRDQYGEIVFQSFLPESDKIAQRPEMRLPIVLSNYRSDENYVNALHAMVDEFIDRML